MVNEEKRRIADHHSYGSARQIHSSVGSNSRDPPLSANSFLWSPTIWRAVEMTIDPRLEILLVSVTSHQIWSMQANEELLIKTIDHQTKFLPRWRTNS